MLRVTKKMSTAAGTLETSQPLSRIPARSVLTKCGHVPTWTAWIFRESGIGR